MKYIYAALSLATCVLSLAGCAGDPEFARQVQLTDARDECRKLSDASAYLECKKRADAVHAKR